MNPFTALKNLSPFHFTSLNSIILLLFGLIKNTNHIFEHPVPQGTPTILIPFIVIIETISNLIRPGTLAVRLTANIIAGHQLLTLLGNNGPSIRHTILTVLITAQILLLILEAAVALIQSYVFAILRTLYILLYIIYILEKLINVNIRKSSIPCSK
jgi:F-type H+-transporting ATPase subunit a